jgi:large subunit ribosomal protein L22
MKVQPRKVRIVADEVRGKYAVHAVHLLRFHPSKSAQFLRKILVSAISNAQENNGLSPDTLKIVRIQVDEGPRQKRIRARAQGRANRIVKKTSHITVIVDESEPPRVIKPHGTKAKPRPKFDAPKKAKKSAPVAEAAAPVIEDAAAELETAATEELVEVSEAPAEAAAVEETAVEATAEAEPAVEAAEVSEPSDGAAEAPPAEEEK